MKKYVCRAERLGPTEDLEPVMCKPTVDVPVPISIVADDGELVESRQMMKSVSVDEYFSPYKVEDFKIQNLVENGVPLKLIHVNSSQSRSIDELYSLLGTIDGMDNFVKAVEAKNVELDQFFGTFSSKNESSSSSFEHPNIE